MSFEHPKTIEKPEEQQPEEEKEGRPLTPEEQPGNVLRDLRLREIEQENARKTEVVDRNEKAERELSPEERETNEFAGKNMEKENLAISRAADAYEIKSGKNAEENKPLWGKITASVLASVFAFGMAGAGKFGASEAEAGRDTYYRPTRTIVIDPVKIGGRILGGIFKTPQEQRREEQQRRNDEMNEMRRQEQVNRMKQGQQEAASKNFEVVANKARAAEARWVQEMRNAKKEGRQPQVEPIQDPEVRKWFYNAAVAQAKYDWQRNPNMEEIRVSEEMHPEKAGHYVGILMNWIQQKKVSQMEREYQQDLQQQQMQQPQKFYK